MCQSRAHICVYEEWKLYERWSDGGKDVAGREEWNLQDADVGPKKPASFLEARRSRRASVRPKERLCPIVEEEGEGEVEGEREGRLQTGEEGIGGRPTAWERDLRRGARETIDIEKEEQEERQEYVTNQEPVIVTDETVLKKTRVPTKEQK